jgi:hypothetical protein
LRLSILIQEAFQASASVSLLFPDLPFSFRAQFCTDKLLKAQIGQAHFQEIIKIKICANANGLIESDFSNREIKSFEFVCVQDFM